MTIFAQIPTTRPGTTAPMNAPSTPAQETVVRGEWSALFAADLESCRKRFSRSCQISQEQVSTPCQEDDDAPTLETVPEEETGVGTSGEKQGEGSGGGRNNANDTVMLSSMLASYTAREKPKIYLRNGKPSVPAEELDRVARTLHDCALAGKPKITVGVIVPELGEIRFDVQIAGKIVFIHAYVDNEQTSAALAAAVSGLRDRLEAHHLILGRLDVTSPGADKHGSA